MIPGIAVPCDDSLRRKFCQSAAYGRDGTELQKKQLLRRDFPVLLLRISDFNNDVKIEHRGYERHLQPFEFPLFP